MKCFCYKKRTVVFVGESYTPVEIHYGKRWINGYEKCRAFMAQKPRLSAAFAVWLEEYKKTIESWIEKTPHFTFYSDVGSLAVRIDGVKFFIDNGYGDGTHKIYIATGENAKELPPKFGRAGFWLDGKHTIELLSYDLGDDSLTRIETYGYVEFYRSCSGDMVITIA